MITALFRQLRLTLEMIRIEHTVFALPFAFLGAVLAERRFPDAVTCAWILLAMVGARSAAMAFNRLADLPFDRENPRTSDRVLPQGRVSRRYVLGFTVSSALLMLLAAYMLNPLAFILAFPALLVILGYSLTKRFTSLTHIVLGFALSIAPAGGWIAVTGTFDPRILLPASTSSTPARTWSTTGPWACTPCPRSWGGCGPSGWPGSVTACRCSAWSWSEPCWTWARPGRWGWGEWPPCWSGNTRCYPPKTSPGCSRPSSRATP